MLRGIREFSRVLSGGGRFGQAERLERRGRLPEARVALLDALAQVEGIRGEIVAPAVLSTRLFAYLALARIASDMKDTAEAACYARKWLAGWAEFRLDVPEARRDKSFNSLAEWESWARQFLAWAEHVQVQPPTMRLEFVGHAGSVGHLLRLYGRDGQVVQRLRRALEGLSEKPLALNAIPGIEAVGDCHLAAVLGAAGCGVEQLGPQSFVWETNGAGWEQVIGLLEPFESPDQAQERFQFLSRGPDVAIVISTDGRW